MKAAFCTDFRNRMVGGKQQIFCVLQPQVGKILGNGVGGFRMKQLADVVRRKIAVRRYILKSDWIFEIFVEIKQHALYLSFFDSFFPELSTRSVSYTQNDRLDYS